MHDLDVCGFAARDSVFKPDYKFDYAGTETRRLRSVLPDVDLGNANTVVVNLE
jgi:hypothetical protein